MLLQEHIAWHRLEADSDGVVDEVRREGKQPPVEERIDCARGASEPARVFPGQPRPLQTAGIEKPDARILEDDFERRDLALVLREREAEDVVARR